MSVELDILEEPTLQFSDGFEHEDKKTGLAEFGPFGRSFPGLHQNEVRLGFIGTGETVSEAREWIDQCGKYIESRNVKRVQQRSRSETEAPLFNAQDTSVENPTLIRLNKMIHRDFIGFNKESPFQSEFQVNDRWVRTIDPRELDPVLGIEDKKERILALVELIEDRLESISETGPIPDVVVIALSKEMEERAESTQIQGGFYLNLRRAIKARAMRQADPVPVQLIRWGTLKGHRGLQEIATRAWNFSTAQYYKAGGVPWRPLGLEDDTCFVGVSFYVSQAKSSSLEMRTSIALAFDLYGQGLVLRGEKFRWESDRHGRTPHLRQGAARELMANTLRQYMRARRTPPRRVVVHKTSEFWGSDHGEFNEVEGFYEGAEEVFKGCEVDLVAARQVGVRLFREGRYPSLRGTYFTVEKDNHFIYTMGYIPFLETYPRPHVPEPWNIAQHLGGSAPKELCSELLALTKMNTNNCSFSDGVPITISFSKKVSEILKHVEEGDPVQTDYRYYM